MSVLEHHLLQVNGRSPHMLVMLQRTSGRGNLRTFLNRALTCIRRQNLQLLLVPRQAVRRENSKEARHWLVADAILAYQGSKLKLPFCRDITDERAMAPSDIIVSI